MSPSSEVLAHDRARCDVAGQCRKRRSPARVVSNAGTVRWWLPPILSDPERSLYFSYLWGCDAAALRDLRMRDTPRGRTTRSAARGTTNVPRRAPRNRVRQPGQHPLPFGADGGAVAVAGVDDGVIGQAQQPMRMLRRVVGARCSCARWHRARRKEGCRRRTPPPPRRGNSSSPAVTGSVQHTQLVAGVLSPAANSPSGVAPGHTTSTASVLRVQEDRRVHCVAQRDGGVDVVVVAVGQHDGPPAGRSPRRQSTLRRGRHRTRSPPGRRRPARCCW